MRTNHAKLTVALASLAVLGCEATHLASDSGTAAFDVGPLPDGGVTAPSTDFVTFTGADRQQFGDAFAYADLDHDGLDDLVLINRSNTDEFGMPYRGGSIVLLYGRRERITGTFALAGADAEIIGPTHQTVDVHAATGDYDGDGIDDVVVSIDGAPGEAGTLHVLYGSTSRISGRPFIEDVAATIVGMPTSLRFPEYVAPAGDVDGDGCDDFLTGYAGEAEGGSVVLVRGSRTRWSGTTTIAPATTFGASGGALAGFMMYGAGDLDGDGHPDLLVGEMSGGNLDVGVFYGPIPTGEIPIASAPAHVVTTSSTWIGVYGRFDANGDGLSDFVVPATVDTTSAMLVFVGARTRLAGRIDASAATATLVGAHLDSNLGVGVSAGDVDGDGRDDLLMGSPNDSDQLGRIDRVYGMPHSESLVSADQTWAGTSHPYPDGIGRSYDEMLGEAVAQDGDFDGDGHADALLGAPGDLVPYGGQRIYFVYGAPR